MKSLYWLAVVSGLILSQGEGITEGILVDRIVAVVNSDILLKSDITLFRSHHADYYIPRLTGGPLAEILKDNRAIVDILVDNLLLEQEIKKLNLNVSEVMLDKEIENILKRNRINHKQLLKLIASEGRTYEEFRSARRREIERFRLLDREIKPRVSVNDYDLKNYYKEKMAVSPGGEELELIDFVSRGSRAPIVPVKKALMKGGLRAARKLCKTRCEEIDLGFMTTEAIRPEMTKALKKLRKGGKVTEIMKIGSVYHLLYVKSLRVGSVPSFETVKEKLANQYYQVALERELKTWLDERKKKSFIEIKEQ